MKNKINTIARRCIAAMLLFPLWGLGGWGLGLSAQVSVSNMTTNYPAKQISFTVMWTSAPHNNQIWVITDYIKVAGTATTGSWSRATVTAVTKNSGTGSVSTVSGNRGFWLNTSGSSGSANITATLQVAAGVDKFNWCAHALDTPPKALLQADGSYKLQGTAPFVVNGTALGSVVKTFGPGTCITTLSDATDNPTFIPAAVPSITAVTSPTICYNTAANLTATVSGGLTTAMTYTWNIGGTSSTTTGATKTTGNLTATTTYTVQARNAAGCTVVSGIGTITVLNPTVPTLAQNGPTCAGAAVTFTASNGSGTYDWAGAFTGNGATKTTSTTAGSSVTKVRSSQTTNGVTCYSSYTAEVTGVVNPAPTGITLTASSTTVCTGSAVTLTASATGATSYSFDGSAYGTATTTTKTVNAASTYKVKARSTLGCESAEATRTVAIQAAPTGITLTASSTTVCTGSAVTLTATSGAASYQFNGGAWQTARTATVTVSAAATYKVKARSTLGCESAEATRTVAIQAAMTINRSGGNASQTVTQNSAITAITYTATNASSITLGGSLPNGLSYGWSSNRYVISGSPTATGTFTYSVTTTNSLNCTNATAYGTITVNLASTGCTTASLNLGTVGFTSSTTYSRNGLTISSPVTATYCSGRCSSFDGGSSGAYKADCAPSSQSGFSGHLFSWCMVAQYASQLCPSPWRVPTKEDHCKIVNNSATNCAPLGNTFNGVVGYTYTGSAIAGACNAYTDGFYWSSATQSATASYSLGFSSSSTDPLNAQAKFFGFGLRCVR